MGPRLRGDDGGETAYFTYPLVKHIHLSNSHAGRAPDFHRARGGPSPFPVPQARGMARRGARDLAFTPGPPECLLGRLRGLRCRPYPRDMVSHLGAPQRHPIFRLLRVQTDRRRSAPDPVSSGIRPGTWLVWTTHAGAASRPNIVTPHDGAPRRTGHCQPSTPVRTNQEQFR
jgi:hypothetical protein